MLDGFTMHVLIYMGDLHLVIPALNLSILDACTLTIHTGPQADVGFFFCHKHSDHAKYSV